jgi:single-strand DNA-binding protein
MSVGNNCTFIGNFTRDPELKQTPGGTSVANFTLAVRRAFVKEGQQDADFINFVAWGKTAEIICKYFKKGNKIAVRGAMRSRTWEDQSKTRHHVVECHVEEMEFVESRKQNNDNAEEDPFA